MINVYSIEEIIAASDNLLEPQSLIVKKKNIKSKKIEIPPETENIIVDAEKSILQQKKNDQNNEVPLLLINEAPIKKNHEIKSFNYKVKIKPEVKDHMINELYLYLKKKIRKNTLRLIIDEQLEIKNLINKVKLLKQTEKILRNNYQELKNNYESTLNNNKDLEMNNEQLSSQINEFKIDNDFLQKNLNQVTEIKDQLDIEIKELKNNNSALQNDLNNINENKEKLNIEIKELKEELNKTKLNLEENIGKNRSYEINNSELKNTVSRYIVNTKEIQKKLNLTENSNNLELDTQIEKVKFYQEENIRLSSELLATQKKNVSIKENLNSIETEKEQISNKIKELNKSIDKKTNIIPSNFIKENTTIDKVKNETLNDQEQKSLDEVINRIFSKI